MIRIPHSLQASAEEIKHAWKKQALLHHPDRLITVTEEAKQRFLDIQHAYEVLKDSMLRAEYDKDLLHRLYLEVSAVFYRSTRRSPSNSYKIDVSLFQFIKYNFQEYLRRFADLILTASGLGLPLEHGTATCTASNLFLLEDAIRGVKEATIATLIGKA